MKSSIKVPISVNSLLNTFKFLLGSYLKSVNMPTTIINFVSIEIPRDADIQKLKIALKEMGVTLEKNRDSDQEITNLIEDAIIRLITEKEINVKFSIYISTELGYSYGWLSTVFRKVSGMSIEKYFIRTKIELAMVMVSDGFNCSQIAERLNFSSVSHLSKMFKDTTGQTIMQYKRSTIE